MIIVSWLILKLTQRKVYMQENTLSEFSFGSEKGTNSSSTLSPSLGLSLFFPSCSGLLAVFSSLQCWVVCPVGGVSVEREGHPFCWAGKVLSDDSQMSTRKCRISKLPRCRGIFYISVDSSVEQPLFAWCAPLWDMCFWFGLYWFHSLFPLFFFFTQAHRKSWLKSSS